MLSIHSTASDSVFIYLYLLSTFITTQMSVNLNRRQMRQSVMSMVVTQSPFRGLNWQSLDYRSCSYIQRAARCGRCWGLIEWMDVRERRCTRCCLVCTECLAWCGIHGDIEHRGHQLEIIRWERGYEERTTKKRMTRLFITQAEHAISWHRSDGPIIIVIINNNNNDRCVSSSSSSCCIRSSGRGRQMELLSRRQMTSA